MPKLGKDILKNMLKYREKKDKQSQSGITLVALVITVIIIIILATVAINFLFGENGLITRAEQAKIQQEIETARETLTMVLGDAFIEKKINPGYDPNGFLDDFIKEREPNVYLSENAIGLDGYVFGLDRSIPELGEYQGEQTGPRIQAINVLEETTSSATIEVVTENAEGATYTYSYKIEGTEEWIEVETKDENSNTCTIEGLTQGEIYNIKVVVTTDTGTVEKEVNVHLGEIPEGTITFTPAEWLGDGTARTTINTSETGYTLQYQIVVGDEEPVNTAWEPAATGQQIEGLHHNETVYGRLFDGTNSSGDEDASITVKDELLPQTATIGLSSTSVTTETSVTATVTHIDNESGPNITACKYVWNTSSANLGTDASKYTGGAFSSNGQQISRTMSTAGTWYLHVLTVDNAGNPIETISNGVMVTTPTIESKLKAGDYVYYTDGKGTRRKCVVLYDSSSSYGVELITMEGVEDVTLSGVNDYNNAISTLNSKASQYNNGTYSSRARCVGSVPNNINSESETIIYGRYSMRNYDTNYETDWNQMNVLGIQSINVNTFYWLASRNLSSRHEGGSSWSTTRCYIRCFSPFDGVIGSELCSVLGNNYADTYSGTRKLRPVFKLKPGIKVTGGSGTSGAPYTLGT